MKNSKTFNTLVEELNYYLGLRDSKTNTQEEIKNQIRDNDPLKRGYDLEKALYPVNPLLVKRDTLAPTLEEIELLKKWIYVKVSVRDSVRYSVFDSVTYSVWGAVEDVVNYSVWGTIRSSVFGSVTDYVWAYVGYSVRDSVEAYISSVFPNIKKWKGIDHVEGINPFQPAIDLWERGLVASFDSETWRLHAGEKAEIVYTLEDL